MDAPDEHNFDTLAGIRVDLEHIGLAAASGPNSTNTAMPPAGSRAPSKAEREKLGEWIACGAP